MDHKRTNINGGDKMKNTDFMMEYITKHHAESLYNKCSNILYVEFNIKSAEITLLVTYVLLKLKEKEGDLNGNI